MIPFSKLGPSAIAQLTAALGEKEVKARLRKEHALPGRGARIKVSAPQERTIDGILFASKWEAQAYIYFRDTLGRDTFSLQPSFVLQEKFTDTEGFKHRAIVYKADFLIGPPRINADDPVFPTQLICDSKGMETTEYLLKRKLFLKRYQCRLWTPKKPSDLREITDWLASQKEKPCQTVGTALLKAA